MKNEEAIKKLKAVQAEFNGNWVDYGGINQAFELAYKALEEKPQGEWEVFRCNKCQAVSIQGKTKFCYNCGISMKGDADNGI